MGPSEASATKDKKSSKASLFISLIVNNVTIGQLVGHWFAHNDKTIF